MSDIPRLKETQASIARPPSDPLGEILHLLKLTGTFYCQSHLTAPWGIDVPALGEVLSFALITKGQCWLKVEHAAPLFLEEGSLVLLSKGKPHTFVSDPAARAVPLGNLPVSPVSEIYETLDYGGGGTATRMMYGMVRMDNAAGALLMELLPAVLQSQQWNEAWGKWQQSTIDIIAEEARTRRTGGEAVVTRLSDIIVIEGIRRWLDTAEAPEPGWLMAARDTQIGQSILAIHRTPAENWTVETLARAAGMSRSGFSARFTELFGVPAMQYVTRWRMMLAREELQQTSLPINAIARGLGYQSEPSFCRAYKRIFKEPPGATRKHAPS